jgi:hypothetical protein
MAAPTTTLERVRNLAADVAGRSTAELSAEDGDVLKRWITSWLYDVWEWAPWPDLANYAEVIHTDGVVTKTAAMGKVWAAWTYDRRTDAQAEEITFEDTGDALELDVSTRVTLPDTVWIEYADAIPTLDTLSNSAWLAVSLPKALERPLANLAGGQMLILDRTESGLVNGRISQQHGRDELDAMAVIVQAKRCRLSLSAPRMP